MAMSDMTKVQRPHAPTLVYALVFVVLLFFVYHLALGKRRR